MSDLNTQLRHSPIAVIGLGAIMPEARNIREFWNNIIGKVDCITDVPISRWDIEDYYDPDPSAPDKTYCKRGGFIPDVEFDPLEFGLPPNILEVTDVSQMLSLLVAKEALADAGYLTGADELRERTGVILGVGGGQKLITPLTSRLQYPVWDEVLKSYGIGDSDRANIIERMKMAYVRWEENSFPGMLGNVISGRIANRFDLGGTNCVVDAACASTMAALKMALSELTERRANMMVTGGVDVDNSIFMYMCFSKTPAFSKSTHPRPFDTESDGMMVGEGIGMMVLKRLDDAERDGDRIYAVIQGLGSSSDGRYKSIYAPRGEGQERALVRAYDDAGFSPATIGLVEAHGTGTVAGDSTEVTTIIRYFNKHDEQKQHIAIGSVKSQIGHTKASAGAAGLIKTVLALHHKVLPPTRNVQQPNPKFDMENSPFYVSAESRPWIKSADDTPRRAGVSSFGFGGTNFHVILQEYTGDHTSAYRMHNVAQGVILNAATPADLRTKVNDALAMLQGDVPDGAFLNLVRETRAAAVPVGAARLGFVAASADEAAGLLQIAAEMLTNKPDAEEWQHPKGIYYRRSGQHVTGHVVALFAGQGSQYPHMGRELALNFPDVREPFARIDALLQAEGKQALSDVAYPRPAFTAEEKAAQDAALQGTDYAQPAIGALSAGLYRLLQKAGFKADFAAGHSFGEVSALWAAGVVSDDDYFALVKARGAAMAPPAHTPNFDAGTMLAVTGDVATIEREVAALQGVQVANRNSRTQVVVAGSKPAVAQAEAALKAKGFKTVPLTVSAAFHTPLVGHAQRPFAEAINKAAFKAPATHVYSNATGRAYPADPTQIKAMLSEHILQPVQFRDQIENIYAAGGTVFVEFGPRNVLTNLVKDILGDRPHVAVALNASRQKDSDRQMREAVVQLQVLGMALGTVDPYAIEQDAAPKKKGLTIILNGANYVSDKTRAAYAGALASGGTVALTPGPSPSGRGEPTVASAPTSGRRELAVDSMSSAGVADADTTTTRPIASEPASGTESVPHSTFNSPSNEQADMNAVLSTLESTLAHFREHQRETQRVHEQFTQGQAEYFRIFFELTQQQTGLLASGTLQNGSSEALNQSMLRFHEYQSETLRMHEAYMRTQTEVAQSLLDIVRQQYATMSVSGAAFTPTAPPIARGPVTSPVSAAPVSTVRATPQVAAKSPEPTWAPAPDVKQPEQPKPAPAEAPERPPQPAQLPPKEEPKPVWTPAPDVEQPKAAAAPQMPAVPTPQAASGGAELAKLSEAMLRIVGDKTGYPVEMLELSMDMEADLGIDSIKRVEILGAMRDEFPALPQFSPEELGELRTLQQIVDYMAARSGTAVTPSPSPAASAEARPTAAASPAVGSNGGTHAAATAPAAQPTSTGAANGSNGHGTPAASAAANGQQVARLAEAMLRIVGDKTGYPVEMLELSMDMEADLGIDSIKRVEILGAMRDEFPALPQFSPEELGELRTLQQIVDYMEEAGRRESAPFDGSGAAAETAAPHAPAESFDTRGIERSVVELRHLPEPDTLDAPPHNAVCVVTDDGTPATAAVVLAIEARGWRTVVLGLPGTEMNPALNMTSPVHLDDWSEDSIKRWLSATEAAHGPIGAYIQLDVPPLSGNGQLLVADIDKALVRLAFMMAKHLQPRLTTGNGTGRHAFIAVTRLDGALGMTGGGRPVSGGLFGLVKSLALEWPGVFCRAVDVAPDASAEDVARWVSAELYDPNRLITEVGYGPYGRVTLAARLTATNGAH